MKALRYIISIAVCLVFAGCTPSTQLPPESTLLQRAENSPVPSPSSTVEASKTPRLTATPIPTAAPSETPTATATLPPLVSQIAFLSNRENGATRILYRMNSDGSNVTPLAEVTGDSTHPEAAFGFSWSPDGQWIAYTARGERLSNWEVAIVDVYGNTTINLTDTPQVNEDMPTWSPDGKYIAYAVKNGVYLLDMETRQSEKVGEILPEDSKIAQFAWSPDSRQLIFLGVPGRAFTDSEIFVHTLGTSEQFKPFINDPTNPNNFMAWSLDGLWFAFTGRMQGITSRQFGVYIVPGTGSDQLVPLALHRTVVMNVPLSWSPDGEYLVYSLQEDQIYVIYRLARSGGQPVRLTEYQGEVVGAAKGDLSPAWSPTGNKIAYASSRDGNLEIYLMNADGSDQVNLTNHPGDDWNPQWQPPQ